MADDDDRRWQRDAREGLRSAADLDRLRLPVLDEGARAAARRFEVRAPASYLERADDSDPDDPIRRQVVPDGRELEFLPGELEDPIGDAAHSPAPRLTHRYENRALLYPTYLCAVYCRHCFRKESINEAQAGYSPAALEPALRYIESTPQLREVILTGGDPLTLADRQLTELRRRLEAVDHLRLLRVHTRVPVALPSRITAGLVAALRGRLRVCVVTHFNHPRELSPEALAACRRLGEAGFMLLNQSVLLAGVNDDAETLAELCEELVYAAGVKPYYLHHCDLTRGVSHFRTSIAKGRAIVRELRRRVSGVCMPEYVLDLPGGAGKIPIGPSYETAGEASDESERGHWRFIDRDGAVHCYRELLAAE